MLEAGQHATGLTPGKARALLGRFLFSGEEAEKPLDGPVRRGAPAAVAGDPRPLRCQRPDPRRADQPSRSGEPRGARGGAAGVQRLLLLVSHDRALLDAVGTRTVALEDRPLHSYVGGWPEYVRVREERTAAAAKPAAAAKSARPKRAERPARPRRTKRPRPSGDPDKLEEQIEAAEAALRALEDELSDPAAWATPQKSADATARHERAKRAGRGALHPVGGGRGLTSAASWRPRRLAQMAPPIDAGRVRVALIDEDSGLLTVLDRRFAALALGPRGARIPSRAGPADRDAAPRADRQSCPHRARVHRADRRTRCPAWRCSSAAIRRRSRTASARCAAAPMTGSPSPATRRSWSPGSRRSCAAGAPGRFP